MLVAVPLLILPVILYNVLVFAAGDGAAGAALALTDPVLRIAMASGVDWTIDMGDLVLLLALLLLFVELLKSTSSQRAAIANHALSMVLFVVCLVQFLLLPGFATSTFFLVMTTVLLDVLAGFIVTIIASRRDVLSR